MCPHMGSPSLYLSLSKHRSTTSEATNNGGEGPIAQASSKDAVPSPPMPWKLRLSISALSAITDPSHLPDGTINHRLLSFLDFRAAANPNAVRGVRSVDLTVNPSHNLWIRVFPSSSAAAAVGDWRILVIVLVIIRRK